MAVPEQIGQYRIVDRLGRGAMGEVYKAVDTKMFDRVVAVKVMVDTLSDEDSARVRFEQEIQVAAKLDHPNIVTIFDRGEYEGRLYFVMEYIEGFDLAHVIKNQEIRRFEDKLRMARQIADGLAHAHRNQLIHRDIKPANIMIHTRGGTGDEAKLVDFGIVRVDQSNLTGDTGRLGTLSYMAPEQLRGDSEIEARADLFSLGIVFFELFSGVHPFKGTSEFVVLTNILHNEGASLEESSAGLPPRLVKLVMRMIEKEPDKRPQTAAEVADELAQIFRESHSVKPAAAEPPASTPTPPAPAATAPETARAPLSETITEPTPSRPRSRPPRPSSRPGRARSRPGRPVSRSGKARSRPGSTGKSRPRTGSRRRRSSGFPWWIAVAGAAVVGLALTGYFVFLRDDGGIVVTPVDTTRVDQQLIDPAQEQTNQDRLAEEAAARAEQDRIAREAEAADRAEQDRIAREAEAADRAEQDQSARTAADKVERDRQAQTAADKAERDRQTQAAADKAERDRQAQAAADKAERDRQAQAAADKAERDRTARAAAAQAEQERQAREAAANSTVGEEEAVLQAIAKWKVGYEELDAVAVKRILPSMDLSALDKAFGDILSYSIDMPDPCRIELVASSGLVTAATATCAVMRSVTGKRGNQDARVSEATVVFHLDKSSGQWLIESAR